MMLCKGGQKFSQDLSLIDNSGTRSAGHSALASARKQGGESPPRIDAFRSVIEDNRVAVKRGGKQSEMNSEPVGIRTRFGLTVWRACCGCAKPKLPKMGLPVNADEACKSDDRSGRVAGDRITGSLHA